MSNAKAPPFGGKQLFPPLKQDVELKTPKVSTPKPSNAKAPAFGGKQLLPLLKQEMELKTPKVSTPKPQRNPPEASKQRVGCGRGCKSAGRVQNAVVGVISGILAGGLLYVILVFNYSYSYVTAGIITGVSTVVICLSLAVSTRARCTGLLMLPSLATGRGRAALFSIISAILLKGPTLNIVHNANELAGSLACGTELAYNQSRDLQELLGRPIEAINRQIIDSVDELRTLDRGLQDALGRANTELSNIENTINSALGSATSACQNSFNQARSSCESQLNSAKRSCEKKLSILKSACKPLGVGSGVCSVVKVTGGVCSVPAVGHSALSGATGAIQAAVRGVQGQFELNILQSSPGSADANISRSASEITAAIKAEFREKTDTVRQVVEIITRVLSAFLFLLFIQAALYLRSYLIKDKHDNIYISRGFVSLDEERKGEGVDSLLPLSKKERDKYIPTKSWRFSPPERRVLVAGLGTFFLHMLVSLVVCFTDYVLFWALDVVRENGRVSLALTGTTKLLVKVTGDGIIAKFVRQFVQGISAELQYNSTVSIDECLPNPTPTPLSEIYTLVAIYIVTLLLVILQGYGLRFRHFIVGYFYPEREAERVQYLYNCLLRKRSLQKKDEGRTTREEQKEKGRKQKYSLFPRRPRLPWGKV